MLVRRLFALVLVTGLVAAGSLSAEPDSKKTAADRPQTEWRQPTAVRNTNAVGRVLTVRDITIFTYQPAPTRLVDARTLRDEGLVRLSINPQGVVTSVKITRSTGHREYDAEAVNAFRRWKAAPGPAREIDLPITAVTTGKKGPVRIPLTQGSLTIG